MSEEHGEFLLRTTQQWHLFDNFIFEDAMAQVIGFTDEGVWCEFIPWDNTAIITALIVDLTKEVITRG